MNPEIVKVGGSLFRWKDFPLRLREWLKARPGIQGALIAGGGENADLVRSWSDRFSLDASTAHWLSIQAMGLQARLLAKLISAPLRLDFAECRAEWRQGRDWVILDPERELRSAAEPLAETWEVTSDSVAAWVARRLNAARLVMMKSIGDGKPFYGSTAFERGWIDPWFLRTAADLPVDWVNLRKNLTSVRLLPD